MLQTYPSFSSGGTRLHTSPSPSPSRSSRQVDCNSKADRTSNKQSVTRPSRETKERSSRKGGNERRATTTKTKSTRSSVRSGAVKLNKQSSSPNLHRSYLMDKSPRLSGRAQTPKTPKTPTTPKTPRDSQAQEIEHENEVLAKEEARRQRIRAKTKKLNRPKRKKGPAQRATKPEPAQEQPTPTRAPTPSEGEGVYEREVGLESLPTQFRAAVVLDNDEPPLAAQSQSYTEEPARPTPRPNNSDVVSAILGNDVQAVTRDVTWPPTSHYQQSFYPSPRSVPTSDSSAVKIDSGTRRGTHSSLYFSNVGISEARLPPHERYQWQEQFNTAKNRASNEDSLPKRSEPANPSSSSFKTPPSTPGAFRKRSASSSPHQVKKHGNYKNQDHFVMGSDAILAESASPHPQQGKKHGGYNNQDHFVVGSEAILNGSATTPTKQHQGKNYGYNNQDHFVTGGDAILNGSANTPIKQQQSTSDASPEPHHSRTHHRCNKHNKHGDNDKHSTRRSEGVKSSTDDHHHRQPLKQIQLQHQASEKLSKQFDGQQMKDILNWGHAYETTTPEAAPSAHGDRSHLQAAGRNVRKNIGSVFDQEAAARVMKKLYPEANAVVYDSTSKKCHHHKHKHQNTRRSQLAATAPQNIGRENIDPFNKQQTARVRAEVTQRALFNLEGNNFFAWESPTKPVVAMNDSDDCQENYFDGPVEIEVEVDDIDRQVKINGHKHSTRSRFSLSPEVSRHVQRARRVCERT